MVLTLFKKESWDYLPFHCNFIYLFSEFDNLHHFNIVCYYSLLLDLAAEWNSAHVTEKTRIQTLN